MKWWKFPWSNVAVILWGAGMMWRALGEPFRAVLFTFGLLAMLTGIGGIIYILRTRKHKPVESRSE